MKSTHIPEQEMLKLRDALEEERSELEEDLREHGDKSEGGDWQGTTTGFEEPEADEVDAADRFEELATNVPLVESLEHRLADVVRAISKMDEGGYGICEVGGEEIPLERLEANPAARTCIAHTK